MTDKSIQSVLRRINNGSDGIFIRPIGPNVYWGSVWGTTPRGYSANGIEQEGYEFFFIKAGDGKFEAAILRMGEANLHWYVSKPYRGRHLLLEPLQKTILPFIFHYHETEMQTAASDLSRRWATPSSKLATKVGFKKISSTEREDVFQITREDVLAYVPMPKHPGDLAELEKLKTQAKLLARSLGMLADAFKVTYSEHMKDWQMDSLLETASYLRLDLPNAIEDVRFSCGATESL